jgi:hypothetical protein
MRGTLGRVAVVFGRWIPVEQLEKRVATFLAPVLGLPGKVVR